MRNEVPTPAANVNIRQSLKMRAKIAKIVFDLQYNHGVTVSTSYILHKLVDAADPKAIIAELAGAAK